MADRVRGDLGHRHAVARLPPPSSARGCARLPKERSTVRRPEAGARAVTLVASPGTTRVITGAILLVAAVAALWFLPPIVLLGIATMIALLAFVEYVDIAARAG